MAKESEKEAVSRILMASSEVTDGMWSRGIDQISVMVGRQIGNKTLTGSEPHL